MARTAGLGALVALVVAFVASGVAGAQDLQDLLGRPVARVRYDPPVPGRDAERDAAIRPGTRITRGIVRAAVERLWRTKRFSDVRVHIEDADSGAVEVVVETRPLFRYAGLRITGAETIGREEIERLIGYRPDGEVWREDLPELAAAVRTGYAERGYTRARVEATLSQGDEPDQTVLELRIREGRPLRVSVVWLDGILGLPRWRLYDALDFEPGDVWDQVLLRDRLEGLLALYRDRGYRAASFGQPVVTPEGSRVAVRVPVDPGEEFDIGFSGNRSVDDDELREALELDEGERLEDAGLEESRKRLERFYRLHGFLHATVALDSRGLAVRGQPVRRIVYRISEGRQMRVVSIRFAGARHFSESFLREQLWSFLEEDVPVPGVFQPVDVDALDVVGVSGGVPEEIPRARTRSPLRVAARTVYEPQTYEEAREHIVELYKQAGYLGIEVGHASIREEENHIAVRFAVTEGVQTLVSEVVFEGNRTVASGELVEIVGIEREAPLSYAAIDVARDRLAERLQEEGLLYATAEPEVDFSETRERARVRYVVDEGPLVRVARVVLRGNERTRGALIRARVALRAGEPYRPSLARRTQERLLDLGVFQAVTVEPEAKDVPEADKVVVVTVVEQLPQRMELRGGFSTGQGARGAFEYRYRNLFGWALAFHARVELGYQVFFFDPQAEDNFRRLPLGRQLERRISTGLSLPHTPGWGGLASGFELALVRENERDFGYDKTSGFFAFSTTTVRRFAPLLEVGVEANDFEYFEGTGLRGLLEANPQFARILRAPEGKTSIGVVRPSASYDLRDNPFAPTKGAFGSLTTEYVQSFAQDRFPSEFVRLSTLLSGYVPIERRVILAVSGRAGRIFHIDADSQTYPDRRFYVGGFDTVRGFLEDTMVPEDLAREARDDPDLAALALPGGDAFATARSELRFPIGAGFQLGVFFDAGNVWSRAENVVDQFVLRTSAGAGLRYQTPVGPLAFDYGLNLAPRAWVDEDSGAFHFSIGVF